MLPMHPNVALFAVIVGLLNCGRLKVLKNSARNCNVVSSRKQPTVVIFDRDILKAEPN